MTGLTSNPTIHDNAIGGSDATTTEIAAGNAPGASDEEMFFELALGGPARAADCSAPSTTGRTAMDGCVSLEVSPLLAYDAAGDIEEANGPAPAGRPNLFIKIPGTPRACPPSRNPSMPASRST